MATIIGIKKLHQDLTKISLAASRGESFIVVKHAKPVFRIEPAYASLKKKYTLQDFKKIRFKSKDRNLSKKVDRIVYGV